MASSGGRIALANTVGRVAYLFRLTRLDRVFPICKDVMSAIEAIEKADAEPEDGKKKRRAAKG
jgi:hypothetical protein